MSSSRAVRIWSREREQLRVVVDHRPATLRAARVEGAIHAREDLFLLAYDAVELRVPPRLGGVFRRSASA